MCGILYRLFMVSLFILQWTIDTGTHMNMQSIPGCKPQWHLCVCTLCVPRPVHSPRSQLFKDFERIDERQVKLLSTAVQHLPRVQPVPQHGQ